MSPKLKQNAARKAADIDPSLKPATIQQTKLHPTKPEDFLSLFLTRHELGPYLASNVVGEPVQSLIETFTRSGTGALDIPAINTQLR
jgi:hypothetical protein